MHNEATASGREVERVGAEFIGNAATSFTVWAPRVQTVSVHLISPEERTLPLTPGRKGYFHSTIDGVMPDSLYKFQFADGSEFPDPASRYQPQGVHGPSAVIDRAFDWSDENWAGVPLEDYILYELHIGTFTPEGTFDSAIPLLDYLKELGITAIEVMPVAAFPGSRNWGYDGVFPFAVQASYGGPSGLKRFVDAAHAKGLAVVLDVVYNHLGPEGNYLGQYGPYFTSKYQTPWGEAINFDGEQSSEVRRYFLENAVQWIRDYHIDALRLDAIHSIHDMSRTHILREIGDAVRASAGDRHVYVIAESDLNDTCVITPIKDGGYGLDAQWSDDFHHSIHSLLTRERAGYYLDFGTLHHIAKAYKEGFVYSGQFSEHRGQCHGTPSTDIPAYRFVICTQNHDQIGNRMLGERLSHLVFREELKLAAGALILSPFIPMLFMGQEYAEESPFLYFVEHSDPQLIEAVRQGRRKEFAAFEWLGEVPDAQSQETFLRSQLRHELLEEPKHKIIYDFHQELIRLRKSNPVLSHLSKDDCKVICRDEPPLIMLHRFFEEQHAAIILNFGQTAADVELPLPKGIWKKSLDSADIRWLGAGSLAPDRLDSDGKVALQLEHKSICLLLKEN